jgi:uncharacterized membrane protein
MRKKSTPVMHRWLRPVMAGIASIGASVTDYLTYTKLTGNQAACPTGGCDVVLSSLYATIFGLPLPLLRIATTSQACQVICDFNCGNLAVSGLSTATISYLLKA